MGVSLCAHPDGPRRRVTDVSDETRPKLGLKARILAGVGGALAAAVSYSIAVYEAREPKVTPSLALGQTIDVGRWRVTPIGASVSDKTPDGIAPLGGGTAVTLSLMVENVTAASQSGVYGLLRLEGAPAGVDPKPDVFLMRDRERLGQLQPRMPERIAAIWRFPAGAAIPETIRVMVAGSRFKPKDNLYAASGWFDPYDAGLVEAKVVAGATP